MGDKMKTKSHNNLDDCTFVAEKGKFKANSHQGNSKEVYGTTKNRPDTSDDTYSQQPETLDNAKASSEEYLQSGGDVATKESAITNGACKTSSFPSPADKNTLNKSENSDLPLKFEQVNSEQEKVSIVCPKTSEKSPVSIHQILNEIEKNKSIADDDGYFDLFNELEIKKQGIIIGYLCAINQEIEFLLNDKLHTLDYFRAVLKDKDLDIGLKYCLSLIKKEFEERLYQLTKIKEEMEKK